MAKRKTDIASLQRTDVVLVPRTPWNPPSLLELRLIGFRDNQPTIFVSRARVFSSFDELLVMFLEESLQGLAPLIVRPVRTRSRDGFQVAADPFEVEDLLRFDSGVSETIFARQLRNGDALCVEGVRYEVYAANRRKKLVTVRETGVYRAYCQLPFELPVVLSARKAYLDTGRAARRDVIKLP